MEPCPVCRPEQLACYLRGELPPDEERSVEEHIEGCPLCLTALQTADAASDGPHSLFPEPARTTEVPNLSEEVLARIARECPTTAPVEPIPPLLPRYEVRGLLGRGGMGAVWRAFDRQLKREVALKTLSLPDEAERGAGHRLLGEAEAVAGLQHEGIVRIYDLGTDAGRPFLSLEYCPGGTLRDRLREAAGPLPPRVAAGVLEQIARAVQHAHQRGLVHRDLKPANVLLVEAPPTPLERCRLKVADFGLAKRVDVTGPTASGAMLGTVAYMAPEQVRGGKGVGPATDVHALGVMLYEMLTGRVPYQGDNEHQTMLRIVHDEPVPPRKTRARLSRDLETICLKCLEKEARHRYADAGQLAEDLRRFQAGETIVARPPGVWRRTGRWLRRRGTLVLVVAALLLITGVALGGWWWTRRSLAREWEAFQNVRVSLRQTLGSPNVTKMIPGPDRTTSRGALQAELEEKVPLYDAMIRRYPADPELQAELVMLERRLAWLEFFGEDRGHAAVLAEKARTKLDELVQGHPEKLAYRSELADAWSDLGTLYGLAQKQEEAQKAHAAAIRHRELVLHDAGDKPDELRELIRDWNALAELHHGRGNRAEVEAALATIGPLHQRFLATATRHTVIGSYLLGRGCVLVALGRDREAEEAFREGLERLDRDYRPEQGLLTRTRPEDVPEETERSISFRTLRDMIGYAEGSPHREFQQVVQFHTRLVTEHPNEIAYQQRLARCYHWLMITMFQSSQAANFKEGIAAARQGMALYDELRKAAPANTDYCLQEAQLCTLTAASLLSYGWSNEEIASWCAKALAVLDSATFGEGQQTAARVLRSEALLLHGTVRVRQERPLQALADFSHALALDPAIARPWFRQMYAASVVAVRRDLQEKVRQGRYREALVDADVLAGLPGLPGQALYDAACAFAVVSGQGWALGVQQERQSVALAGMWATGGVHRAVTPWSLTVQASRYVELNGDPETLEGRCVELLRRAHAAGFGPGTIPGGDPIQHMERDEDLVAVRDRADYQRLLAELKQKR
jgi:tetratricopeptide (TPR) repeat protein